MGSDGEVEESTGIVEESKSPAEEVEQKPTKAVEEKPAEEVVKQDGKKPVAVPVEEVKAVEESKSSEPEYPHPDWFNKWKETLYLPNIKASISHTYGKAMALRNQLLETDGSTQNQIVNIEEDQLAIYLTKFSLKGLLPVMPKILVTTYRGNDSIDTWLIAYLWGLIFMHA